MAIKSDCEILQLHLPRAAQVAKEKVAAAAGSFGLAPTESLEEVAKLNGALAAATAEALVWSEYEFAISRWGGLKKVHTGVLLGLRVRLCINISCNLHSSIFTGDSMSRAQTCHGKVSIWVP